MVASSPAAVDSQLVNASFNDISGIENSAEVGNIPGTLRESYSRCVQENRQLKMEVGTQRMKLESCQDQSRLNQKKLNDEIKELKTRLYEMDGNLDMLSKQLEDKNDDMQHMESLNQVLMLKERINNSELQEARIELKSVWCLLFGVLIFVVILNDTITPHMAKNFFSFGMHYAEFGECLESALLIWNKKNGRVEFKTISRCVHAEVFRRRFGIRIH
ncbi:hypothetical protein AQUCO_00300074v1 [Aquilegia coerulea]|uniref:Uncharacterized protein n=1 Tax=Aquilegia coerulea TaxID=218851 RepID=A0A2G5EX60_AQUCA|nr:hypothetical protein AQUCO_00300074v1 [Aquilegia coerulea]